MTTYDLSWEPLSPMARPPQSDTTSQYAKTTASPTSEYFDITAAWSNHPEPYRAQPPSPTSASSRYKGPELTHRYSADLAHSIIEGVSTHCSSCGLAFSPAVMPAEDKFSHLCADIAREHECPDTHRPSPAERRASLSRRSPARHQRRHSSLYDPLASQGTVPDSEPLNKQHQEEANPGAQSSSSPIELESREPRQEPPHIHHKGTDFYAHTLTSVATGHSEHGPHPHKQEPHHVHDKGTDFYAHTLTSLTASPEHKHGHEQSPSPRPTRHSTQLKAEDIHHIALNEASPTDDPYYQTPAARLSLEHERQEERTQQGRFVAGWASEGPMRQQSDATCL